MRQAATTILRRLPSSLVAAPLVVRPFTSVAVRPAAVSITCVNPRVAPVTSIRGLASHNEVIPSLGDSISEGTLNAWQAKEGEYVNRDDILAVVETDKVAVELRATKAGVLKKQIAATGSTVKVGAQFAEIDTDAKAPAGGKPAAAPAAAPKAAAPAPAATSTTTVTVAAAPAPVSAPAPVAAAAPARAAAPGGKPKLQPLPVIQKGERTSTTVPFTRMRGTIAKRLKGAQNQAAMLTTFNEIDMSAAMALRTKYQEAYEKKHNIKLGFMSIFAKASANALVAFPDVNAYFKEAEGVIQYNNFVDMGIAVATPTGLVVPNLRNVENMTFRDIEVALSQYADKARNNKIAMEDMAGGTFTISNGGVFGSLFGTPIINPPQSAILGMHGINRKPWVVGAGPTEKIEIRPIMVVALTYDHRIIDGSTAVRFLKSIKTQVEDPAAMLLEL